MPHLPLQFLNAIGDCPGLQMQNFIEAHEKEEKVTSVRFNPFKPVELDFQCASAVPWSQNACYLGERPSFGRPKYRLLCFSRRHELVR